MNRSLILFLGIMVIMAGCISQSSETSESGVTSASEASATDTAIIEQPTPAKVCTESGNQVFYDGQTYVTKCINKSVLEKAACKDNLLVMENISCGSGQECYMGACRLIPQKCFDSDGGNNINVTGTLTYMGAEYTDYCEAGNLHEYYCFNDAKSGGTVSCPQASHCVSGKCVYWPPTCTQKGAYVKMDYHTGSVVLLNDYCKDTETLVHYYCEGNANKTMMIPANDTQFCDLSKKTIVNKECTDTDGGAIKDVSGIVKYGLDEYPDKCVGGYTAVKEYFCEDGKVESVVMECKNGCADNIMGDIFGTFVGYCS
jgi:hypothetical protein